MKTVNQIKSLLQRSAVVAAAAIVASGVVMKHAGAGEDAPSKHQIEADAIYDEVVKECHHKSRIEPLFYVVATRFSRSAPTQEEEAKYLANDKNFANAQAASKCWTRDRWARYVKATIADQRYQHAKLKAAEAARNGSK